MTVSMTMDEQHLDRQVLDVRDHRQVAVVTAKDAGRPSRSKERGSGGYETWNVCFCQI